MDDYLRSTIVVPFTHSPIPYEEPGSYLGIWAKMTRGLRVRDKVSGFRV